MKKDRIIYRIGLILALLCLAGGLCFRYKYQLREPVFLENEKAVSVSPASEPDTEWQAELTLRYISDEKNDKMVRFVEFPELNDTVHFGSSEEHSELLKGEIEQYGRYVLHTMKGQIKGSREIPDGNKAVITTARVTYTDGSIQDVDLGKIVLLGESVKPVPISSDSSGKGEQVVYPEAGGTVTVEEVLFPETAENLFVFTVNGIELEDFSSLQLKKGEALTVECRKAAASLLDDGFTDRQPVLLLKVDSGGSRQILPYLYETEQASDSGKFSCYKFWRYLERRGVFG